MKTTVKGIVLFFIVLAFCATGRILFVASRLGRPSSLTLAVRTNGWRDNRSPSLSYGYERLLEGVSSADKSVSQSTKDSSIQRARQSAMNVSTRSVSQSTKDSSIQRARQSAMNVSTRSVSQSTKDSSIQRARQSAMNVSTRSVSQSTKDSSIQRARQSAMNVSTRSVSQSTKDSSIQRARQLATHVSTRSVSQSTKSVSTNVSTQRVNQSTKSVSTQSVSQSSKTVSSKTTDTDSPKDKRHSTLRYSQWMIDVPCLAKIASSPMYLKSMNTDEFLCCLKSIRDSIPLGLSLQDQSTLQSAKFSKWFIETLPVRDIPRFGSCAVVASASSLKKYRYGKEIDSHDAVFRFNASPTVGYEHLVGRRTTVRVINSQLPYHYNSSKPTLISSMLEHSDKDLIIFERDEIPSAAVGENPVNATAVKENPAKAAAVINSSLLWDKSKWNPISKYMTLRHKFPNVPYYLTHPVFTFFSQWRMLQYYSSGQFHEASSGFVGVLLASFICDSVTSYEVATNDPFSSRMAYYYGYTFDYSQSWHPLRIERELLLKMGKCRPRTTTCTINIADAVC